MDSTPSDEADGPGQSRHVVPQLAHAVAGSRRQLFLGRGYSHYRGVRLSRWLDLKPYRSLGL